MSDQDRAVVQVIKDHGGLGSVPLARTIVDLRAQLQTLRGEHERLKESLHAEEDQKWKEYHRALALAQEKAALEARERARREEIAQMADEWSRHATEKYFDGGSAGKELAKFAAALRALAPRRG